MSKFAKTLLSGTAPLLALLIAGCTTTAQPPAIETGLPAQTGMYGPIADTYDIPALDESRIDPKYKRQLVDYRTHERPGTMIVDPRNRFLYLVMENGKAMRYGIGVGKAGLEFTGSAEIGRKAQWPGWTPTPNMIRREPERYGKWAKGMEGGPQNPLGARALYLHQNGRDTLYRIHGTTEPWTIGKAVSSGCIRLVNHDIIDLHSRVTPGSRVVVLD